MWRKGDLHETPDWNTARGGVWGESNPTNIKYTVFRGDRAITLIIQKTLADAIFPMSQYCWSASFSVSMNLSVSQGN